MELNPCTKCKGARFLKIRGLPWIGYEACPQCKGRGFSFNKPNKVKVKK